MPHVRCKQCAARRTLARVPDDYQRPPLCKGCGRSRSYRVDRYRDTVELRVKPCHCYGYSFPHRRGCLYCDHNPKLTAAMLQARSEAGQWA